MLSIIIQNIVRFFVLILVQVLIIKNIELGRYIHPFLYTLYILFLPFETPKSLLLFVSFLLGLILDMFYNTPGMHAAACVFMAFLRPGVLRFISPRDGYEVGATPTIKVMGFSWFITYSSILIIFHHLLLFFIESFSFANFLTTMGTVFASSFITLILVTTTQYLFYNKRE